MSVRGRGVVVGIVALFLVAAFAVWLSKQDFKAPDISLPAPSRDCTVRAGDDSPPVTLDAAQMANAATITAVGVRRKVPERGVVVALATALQESKLENLPGGDRDSLGLFQQRPSQGWGKPEQIRDPRYAAGKFYTGLKKVRGWQDMRVTDAAQAVQRSAYPEAYEKWSDEAGVLAAALLGRATGAVACTVPGEPLMRGVLAATSLTKVLNLDWGRVETVPEGAGFAVAAVDATAGWRYAHWLVSHATDHGVKTVRFAGLEWSADGGRWSKVDGAGTSQVQAEVFADA
ncbi:hypothetical protein SAMN05421684_2011 [Asanoa ishikariensis]|uniref:Uncharacterized protein n=1 Tax=Asanoa ishikariensis TaxID=137265 RepID=A0A1H3NEB3_9ACTN|nr:hypothetical protein SAMN05421684_2011 [Asanoa ishikariensis]